MMRARSVRQKSILKKLERAEADRAVVRAVSYNRDSNHTASLTASLERT